MGTPSLHLYIGKNYQLQVNYVNSSMVIVQFALGKRIITNKSTFFIWECSLKIEQKAAEFACSVGSIKNSF